jgi:Dolichyl-phosphate-mannose-protein mannosyltransferase
MEALTVDRSTSFGPTIGVRTFPLLAVLIAILHAVMAITATLEKSPVYDEPAHLTVGYSYWLKNDFRLGPENGNLPQRWAALPLLFSRPNFVSVENQSWQRASEGVSAHQFFYERGNDSDDMLQRGRIMMALFSAALCLLIYRCSREFFGPLGGLLSEILAAFDPTMLAHGALVTSDITVTLFFTASVWTVWRMSSKLSLSSFMLAAVCLSGLFLAKFSAPIILPVISILGAIRVFSRDSISVQVARWQTIVTGKWKKAAAIAISFALLGVAVLLAIWASFCFRFDALTDNGSAREVLNRRWNYTLADHGAAENLIDFARTHHLLPEAYLYGLVCVHKHAVHRPAFLDNQWSVVGFRSFFPRAFLYKTTPALFCLLALALVATAVRWRNSRRFFRPSSWAPARIDCVRFAPFWVFALIYGAFALTSSLNIGHRHILPIYPMLFIACGACSYFFQMKKRALATSAVALVSLWQIGESVAVRPDYLAYFNEFAGGPSHGYEHLVDSSLDWGQDLPGLKTWLDEHRAAVAGKPLYLAYFGSGEPQAYGIRAQLLPWDPSGEAKTFSGLTGGLYCVSATVLQQVYANEMGQWSQPYEDAYTKALAEMVRYRRSSGDPEARAQLIKAEGAERWLNKIQAFEALRLARLCADLRKREPIAKIGYSIFVYSLSNHDVDLALYGPPAELVPQITVIEN